MTNSPGSVFLVKSVLQGPWVPGAVVLYARRIDRAPRSCTECFVDNTKPPCPLTIEGFSDICEIDRQTDCFFPVGPPLISWRDAVSSLASKLSGVTDVDVGFRTWNQTQVDEPDMFQIEPKLGALFVSAVCPFARDVKSRAIRRCRACGHQQIDWSKILDRLGDLRVSAHDWPGTDFFVVEGASQTRGICATGAALEKLGGFRDSLELIELDWY